MKKLLVLAVVLLASCGDAGFNPAGEEAKVRGRTPLSCMAHKNKPTHMVLYGDTIEGADGDSSGFSYMAYCDAKDITNPEAIADFGKPIKIIRILNKEPWNARYGQAWEMWECERFLYDHHEAHRDQIDAGLIRKGYM